MIETPAFGAFVAPARGRAAIWRLLAGLGLCLVSMAAWMAVIYGGLVAILGAADANAVFLGMAVPRTPGATLLLLFTFVGMALGPMAAARLLHRRQAGTLVGPWSRALRHFALAAVASGAVYAVGMAIWANAFDADPNLAAGLWIAVLPLTVAGLLIQTGAEELLFRGYIMQQLAARFPVRSVYMLVPSALFGVLHYDPSLGANAWAVVGSAALFGLIAADLTRVTGSIGAAWGLHFVNNLIAVGILATRGTITGLSLFLTPYAVQDVAITGPLLIGDLIMVIVVWAVLRMVLTR